MSGTAESLLVVLNADGEVALDELPQGLPRSPESILRLLPLGTARADRFAGESVDWTGIFRAAEQLSKETKARCEEESRSLHLVLGGLAPLPLFVFLGQRLSPWCADRITLVNRRRDGQWDTLPIRSPQPSDHQEPAAPVIFDVVDGLSSQTEHGQGRVALFISTMGQPAPKGPIAELCAAQGQSLAAVVEIRTSQFTYLDAGNARGAYRQLTEILSQAPLRFPHASGFAIFVAGPAPLAAMIGFALPNAMTDLWLTTHRRDGYRLVFPLSRAHSGGQPVPSLPPLTLKELRVRGFKSARDTGWLQLPELAVLVGRNGSGKSTVLEALQWLQHTARDGLREATKRYRSFRDVCTKGSDKISIGLCLAGQPGEPAIKYEVEVCADERGAPTVWSERCIRGAVDEIFVDDPEDPSGRRILGGNPVRDGNRLALTLVPGTDALGAQRVLDFLHRILFLRLHPHDLAQPGPLEPLGAGPLLDEQGTALPALLDALGKPVRDAVLLAQLTESLGGDVQIQEVTLDRNELDQTGALALEQLFRFQDHDEPHRLPAKVLSEGTRRLVTFYAVLAHPQRPSLLVIEEIENGLDPWTLSSLLTALRHAAEDGTPTVLTTHSPFFLNKFDPAQIIHVALQHSESHYRPIKSYQDVLDYEGDVPVGVMYLSDYFKERG